MAKAQRELASEGEGANDTGGRPGAGDPLGGLVEAYRVSLMVAAVSSGVVGLLGLGVLGYALSRRPHPLTALMVGGFTLLFALWWFALHLMNAGRRLEIRKRGLRFVEWGRETTFLWNEIRAIDVDREDATYLGVATVHRRSSDLSRRSGPTTKTDWDVTIRGPAGQTIRLRQTFLRIVRDPRKLIANLRLRAGLDRG